MDDRLDDPLLFRPDTAFGVGGAIPFFGTKVDTAEKKEVIRTVSCAHFKMIYNYCIHNCNEEG